MIRKVFALVFSEYGVVVFVIGLALGRLLAQVLGR